MSKHSIPFLRSAYNYDMNVASVESGLLCEDPSLAQQSAKDETDINFILERVARTGRMPESDRQPSFGDFTGFGDYHSALNTVIAAQDAFMELPAKLRARFDNDPGKYVAFFEDEKNRDEAVELGLVSPKMPLEAPRDTESAVGASKGKVSKKPSPALSGGVPKGYKLVPEGEVMGDE